jgi:hypothetical protein
MNEVIFLIQKLVLNPWENQSSEAVYYAPHSYTDNEEDAVKFCEESPVYTKNDCWAITVPTKKYAFTIIPKLNP